ncbi:MAG: transporter substrate-binding domain-containing protein [Pseudopelagicola sp.]|nr:transporter substrate-binding domain-containing protein [Pseudopelagicola sp.]
MQKLMMCLRALAVILLACAVFPDRGFAQDGIAPDALVFATVDRPPFSKLEDGEPSGFSIDLMQAIALRLDRPLVFAPQPQFADMLNAVRDEAVDGAIANISITAARESEMDFSLPIFESGLQILLPKEDSTLKRLVGVLNGDILTLGLLALGLLFAGGMVMWVFERGRQPYFDRPLGDAMFPSFWWALNLVVNGGFEERMPMSRFGRVFAVLLVISSLFIVSVFVATITAAVTVDAIQESVDSINDLDSRQVVTVSGSTSADFLAKRDISFVGYDSPDQMLAAFASGRSDAVVFDGPILAYYVLEDAAGNSRLIDKVYRPESYGIALPEGSPLREEINRALLALREDGSYGALVKKWFGQGFRTQ